MAATTATPAHDPRRDHTLDTIAGHALPRTLLNYMMDSNRLPHALLLHGPAEVGKTSFAWATAKEILWRAADGQKDGDEGLRRRERLNSRVSREDTHPDVFNIAPSGAAGQIKVGDIRDFMEQHSNTGPTEGRARVLIIEAAETINDSAGNAMLKLLEEPPSYLRFLLVTDTPHRMLETIRSRCAQLRFQPLAEDELRAWLVQKTGMATGPALERALRLAEGRPNRALTAMQQTHTTASQVAAILADFRMYGFPSVFQVAARLCELSSKQEDVLGLLLQFYRDELMSQLALDDLRLEAAAPQAAQATGASAGLPHHPRALMVALEEIAAELARSRNVFNREMQIEGLLCRMGRLMRAA